MTMLRKNGDKKSFPFTCWSGLLEAKHVERIGEALWSYLWLIDRITKEDREAWGFVLGANTEIQVASISKSLGKDERTIRRHLHRLTKYGYIQLIRAPHGFIIKVKNSHKWPFKKKKETGHGCPPTSDKHVRTVRTRMSGVERPNNDFNKKTLEPGAFAPEEKSGRWYLVNGKKTYDEGASVETGKTSSE